MKGFRIYVKSFKEEKEELEVRKMKDKMGIGIIKDGKVKIKEKKS